MEQRLCKYCLGSGVHPRKSDGVFVYCRYCPIGIELGRSKKDMENPTKEYANRAIVTIKEEARSDSYNKPNFEICHNCNKNMLPLYKELESGALAFVPSYFCTNPACQLSMSPSALRSANWREK